MSALTPESSVAAKVFPSPNHGERKDGQRPSMLILHYTGMPDEGEALQWLCNPVSQVSAHYFVFGDGRVLQLVPEARRAWHAGLSSWDGDTDINSCSIGIDRKSTRLNSSHANISYAVFCLKKKTRLHSNPA